MSHSYRQPVGAQPSIPVGQTPLSGRMVAPICTTGLPAVYPVMTNSYGLLSQQPQQYIGQTVVYPHVLSTAQNRVPFVTAIPSNVPRMFVPVTPVRPGMSPSTPDPSKLLEEQRRLEKERNFQLQQERLKQFTVAGKKGSMNADNLIDSMFGKFQPKKTNSQHSISAVSSTKTNEVNEEKRAKSSVSSNEKSGSLESSITCQDFSYNFTTISNSTTVPAKKDGKELDSMMLECSNLNAPSKASKFAKPSVKEIIPSSSHGTTFTVSDKARDWRNIQGLNDVFTAPRPRFPHWCSKGKIADLYKTVHAAVTNNDMHAPDTNLLFPILMSSGLSRELLGQIWELVNESASGQLSAEEMYAVLALIAVAQAGHPIKTTDILHQLPSCPVPQLSVFSSGVAAPVDTSTVSAVIQPNEANTSLKENDSHQLPNQQVHQIVRPTAISLANTTPSLCDQKDVADIAGNVAAWKPFADSVNTPDDEFDDFKSATPTAINFSLGTPTSIPPVSDDDFDDFKQATPVQTLEMTNTSYDKAQNTSVQTSKPYSEAPQQDLMSPEEDKYSVFRNLQQNDSSCQWGDFNIAPVLNSDANSSAVKELSNGESTVSAKYPSVLVTESSVEVDYFKPNSSSIENPLHDEEFGDFIHANPPSSVSTAITDFADFSNFKQVECEQLSSPQIDDEFGEFASSVPVSLKPELGYDFLFRHLKDNISLAESQSVSSLELGTFDGGGGHSGESKSSLSRQGSIPSLDLKSVGGLDGTDSEDCFAEIQLSPFVPPSSKSPSPVSNNKGSDDNESSSTPLGLVFQASLPLTDKYSVIRQEKSKEEDQHISCWIRCLQSCINILQNTKKIFNQMSCSSVCNEVLSSEEGGNYIRNVIEVYKVVCRIRVASKSVSKQTEAIIALLNEGERVWNTISGFFAGSILMPEERVFNFTNGVLKPEPENNIKACGLCLLNIDLRNRSFKQEERPKLSYGGRNYHSTCANFWVNCVDPLLPALTLPQLL